MGSFKKTVFFVGFTGLTLLFFVPAVAQKKMERPNILWITCEDMSPHLGSYGDPYARTPNLDQLAREGVRYTRFFANAPVCTPARSTIITGVFASSLGTQHLRQPLVDGLLPEEIRPFTEYLREAGYYCTNNSKEDYNFKTPEAAWDESGKKAHWRNRKPGQPFFSVFNDAITHQALIRYDEAELIRRNERLPEHLRHDPKEAVLPPYYPDTREVRNNIAAQYTQITLMDRRIQNILDQLKEDGLEEETIVFFYADHGDGLPRGKRWLHETGTRVPLIIRFPEKYKHLAPSPPNTTDSRLLSFVDLAPTLLNMLELTIPEYMQGTPFLGKDIPKNTGPVYLFSDRVGEVLDMSRALRDEKFRYIHNYFPYKDRMQFEEYSEVSPIRITLRKLDSEGKLHGPTEWLMEKNKPVEELYDVENDPYEMNNLALHPKYKNVLQKMRSQLNEKMIQVGDLSFLPEAEMKKRANKKPPYKMDEDPKVYDLKSILKVANMAGHVDSYQLVDKLDNEDSAIRYWALTGISADDKVEESILNKVETLLDDENPSVRIAAAEALFIHQGFDKKAIDVIVAALNSENFEMILHASSTLEYIDKQAGKEYLPEIVAAYKDHTIDNAYSAVPLKHVIDVLSQ